MRKKMKEKKRFPAKDGAVAAFVKPVTRHYTNLGQIVDMNLEGLSLKYLSREEGHLTGEAVVLDIFGIGRPLLGAGKVECRVVNDIPLTDHYRNALGIRLCTLEFQALSREQEYNIGNFVEAYSVLQKEQSH